MKPLNLCKVRVPMATAELNSYLMVAPRATSRQGHIGNQVLCHITNLLWKGKL